MIAVVDYKAGNLTSVMKAITEVAGENAVITDDPEVLWRSDRIILPGVGHFSSTRRLDDTGMTSAIRIAIARGTPFLGICVGMQWLLQGSEEAPEQPGLGYFAGRCERFPSTGDKHFPLEKRKVPHVGWNAILTRHEPTPAKLFAGVQDQSMVYFTHSYFVPTTCKYVPQPAAKVLYNPTAAVCRYIENFAAAVEHENVMGVQFHPEKSGAIGLKVLENFVRL